MVINLDFILHGSIDIFLRTPDLMYNCEVDLNYVSRPIFKTCQFLSNALLSEHYDADFIPNYLLMHSGVEITNASQN